LKAGGICLVLSSRRGIVVASSCTASSEYEKRFWRKAEQYDNTINKYSIGKYQMSEAELPLTMEKYGFQNIHTGFATIDLTPDHPKFSAVLAHDIINAERYSGLDAIESVAYTMPEQFTTQEMEEMKRLVNAKYDTRISLYDCGKKQWDTNVSIMMVIRAVKSIPADRGNSMD